LNDAEKNPVCSFCENEVKEGDDFCPNCGSLFAGNVKCSEHQLKEAGGVCVICTEPYCEECGMFVDERIFLCAEHSEYETLEGMASVLEADDSSQLEIVKSDLEEEGLHPFIYSRKISSVHTSLVYEGQNIHGVQLMVPFQEVIRAEEILSDMGLIE
jgi:RNA polymerase subunit RPABC4/transcription elongation factor Spt4